MTLPALSTSSCSVYTRPAIMGMHAVSCTVLVMILMRVWYILTAVEGHEHWSLSPTPSTCPLADKFDFVRVHNMNDIDAHTGYLVYCIFVWHVYIPSNNVHCTYVCTADIWDVLQWWWAPYRTDDWSASGVKVSLGEWICTLHIYYSCHTLQWHVQCHVCASKCYSVCVHRFCTPRVVCKWYGHVQHVTGGHCVKTPVQA